MPHHVPYDLQQCAFIEKDYGYPVCSPGLLVAHYVCNIIYLVLSFIHLRIGQKGFVTHCILDLIMFYSVPFLE